MNNDMSLAGAESVVEYVTVILEDQMFGLPIGRVQDVFMPESLTRVPLAPPEIAGVLNLRGRIVTAVDLRCRLGLPPRAPDVRPMAVGIEWRGESYGLLVDAVGEVMKLADSGREPNPVNLDPKFAEISMGVHRLEAQLLVVLDVERALASPIQAIAA
jgi:purine-binding chemotaxis protein CheW